MSTPPTASTSKGAVLGGWLATILLNIAFPIVTYSVLTGHGLGQVPALLLGGIGPAVELAINLIRARRVDEFSIIVLIFLAIGVISALAFNTPRLVLIKESAGTGLFGVVLLASLLAPRPLMFYFGRRFATNGIPERIEYWNGLWQYPGFRRAQRILTLIWGATLTLTAGICIALVFVLSVSTMVVITNVVPYAVIALLVIGTMTYGRRAGRARANAAAPA